MVKVVMEGDSNWGGRPGPLCFSQLSTFACYSLFYFFEILNLFLYRGGRKRRRETQCVVVSHVPPSGDLACNPGMCPTLGIEQMTLWFTGGC